MIWRAGGKALCVGGVSPMIGGTKKGRGKFEDCGSQKDAENDVADVEEKTRVRDTGGLRHVSFHQEGRAIRSFLVAALTNVSAGLSQWNGCAASIEAYPVICSAHEATVCASCCSTAGSLVPERFNT
jgi:hypothetical protein